jgi:hypothetical protein
MGPKFAGVCSNGLENIDCLEVAGVRDFFFRLSDSTFKKNRGLLLQCTNRATQRISFSVKSKR